jgi:hypothetical protein
VRNPSRHEENGGRTLKLARSKNWEDASNMPTTIPARKSEYRMTLLERVIVLLGQGSIWYTCYTYPYDRREFNASVDFGFI